MYAERKKIPLGDVRIKLSHIRRHPAKFPDGDVALGRIDAIEGSIQLIGDLEEGQRKRLLEIAGRCYMHRTLSAGVDIRFQLDETLRDDIHRQGKLRAKSTFGF